MNLNYFIHMKLNFYVCCIFFLLMLLALIFLLFISLLLFLDSTYRPNVLQYRFNFFLDKIIPITALISPSLFILFLNTENISWMQKLSYIIIIHVTIVTPIIYNWSKYRSWYKKDKKAFIYSWNEPILYYYITLFLIYVYIWFFYFTLIRFSYLGTQFNILPIVYSLFSWESCVILFIVQYYYWKILARVIYSIHIECLSYPFYVTVMEKIFKAHFIFFNIICLNAPLNKSRPYKSYNIIRKIIHNMYYYPIIIYVFFFFTILVEIFLTNQIAFSYYILFWFPIIMVLFKSFTGFGRTFFIKDVCMVDYLKQNLYTINYEPIFWRYIEDPDTFYGFSINLPIDKYQLWEKCYLRSSEKDKIYTYNIIDKLVIKINKLQEKYPYHVGIYFSRIKIAYYKTYKIRWNHLKSYEKRY